MTVYPKLILTCITWLLWKPKSVPSAMFTIKWISTITLGFIHGRPSLIYKLLGAWPWSFPLASQSLPHLHFLQPKWGCHVLIQLTLGPLGNRRKVMFQESRASRQKRWQPGLRSPNLNQAAIPKQPETGARRGILLPKTLFFIPSANISHLILYKQCRMS